MGKKKQKEDFEIINTPESFVRDFKYIARNMDVSAQSLYRKLVAQTIQSFPDVYSTEDLTKKESRKFHGKIHFVGEEKKNKLNTLAKNIGVHPTILLKLQLISFVLAQPDRLKRKPLDF